MISHAEEIAIESGFKKISITSGVGARKYYEKLGYRIKGYYMIKEIYDWQTFYTYIIYLGLFTMLMLKVFFTVLLQLSHI